MVQGSAPGVRACFSTRQRQLVSLRSRHSWSDWQPTTAASVDPRVICPAASNPSSRFHDAMVSSNNFFLNQMCWETGGGCVPEWSLVHAGKVADLHQ